MEDGEGEKMGESEPGFHTQQLCRFFSQGRHCNFGKKCRFLHIRDDGTAPEKKNIRTPGQSDVTSPNSKADGGHEGHRPPPTCSSRVAPAAGRRLCRYFMSGHCTMEDRCRFWHPPQLPQVGDQPSGGNYTRPAQRMAAVARPSILQEVKLCELTEDVVKQLRDTEIKQLKKRFPKDQLIIQEQSDGKLTYYRATVGATDPDWVNIFFYVLSPLLPWELRAKNPPSLNLGIWRSFSLTDQHRVRLQRWRQIQKPPSLDNKWYKPFLLCYDSVIVN